MEQKPVKLLVAVTKSNWGGAQRYVYDIAKLFQKEKAFSVSVLVGGDGSLVQKLDEIGIRVITAKNLERNIKLSSDLRSLFFLYRTLQEEKPDIFHVNSSKMGFFGALLGRITGVPRIIFTAHAWPFNEKRPLYQRVVFRALAFATVLLAHKTIAVSHAVIKDLKAPFWLQKKITCIYNGIETPNMYPRGVFFDNYPKAKEQVPHLVSVGELHTSKGHDRVLFALSLCKQLPFTYHILGSGEKFTYLSKLIEQLGLQDRVILHGFVENAFLYLNSFDVFILPSRTEALGYVAIEALFTNLPVIASNVGGIPEVLFDDPYTKLIDCSDEKKLKEALIAILKKTPQVDHKKRPGVVRFSHKTMLTATKKVYLKQETV